MVHVSGIVHVLRNGTVSFQQLERTGGLTAEQLNIIGDFCYKRKWSNQTQVKLIRIAQTISDLQGIQVISMKALFRRNEIGCWMPIIMS